MASRSRKRRRTAQGTVSSGETAASASRDGRPKPEPQPSLTRPPQPTPEPEPALTSAESMRRGYARSRERDELLRQGLEPLAPGERPGAVTIAAIVALCFAIANVIAALAGADLASEQNDPAVLTAVTTAILLGAAIGMWLRQYWAVLGFQVILALQIIVFSLAAVRVQKWWLGVGILIAIGLLTWLFWKLIRAMARLQMPTSPAPRSGEPTQ